MAFFTWNLTMPTGTLADPLDQTGVSWKYRYMPYPAIVEILHRSTVTGVQVQVTAGTDEIQQLSPVSAGGTDGVLTGRLNVEPLTFKVAQGDLITVSYRNTNAGTAIVQGSIETTKLS